MESLVGGKSEVSTGVLGTYGHLFIGLGEPLEMLLHIEGGMKICSHLESAFVRTLNFGEKDQIHEHALRYDVLKKVGSSNEL